MTTHIEMPATTPEAAKVEAVKVSRANPGKDITGDAVFGLLYISIAEQLHIHAPTDGHPSLRFYVLNGKIKRFTDKQCIADQNATPTMN